MCICKVRLQVGVLFLPVFHGGNDTQGDDFGGDPFYQVEAFTELARRIKEETTKTIWCWTGFTLEEIQASARLSQLLPYIDVLVDGPFILEQRDTDLLFRGSPNQRIIYLHGAPPEDIIPDTVALEPLR